MKLAYRVLAPIPCLGMPTVFLTVGTIKTCCSACNLTTDVGTPNSRVSACSFGAGANREEAEDVVQETLTFLWGKRRHLQVEKPDAYVARASCPGPA